MDDNVIAAAMDGNTTAAIINGCVAIIVLVVGFVLKGDIKRSENVAQKAVEQTTPVSNGFASKVTGNLDVLVADVSYLKGVVDTLTGGLLRHSETLGSHAAMLEALQLRIGEGVKK